MKCTYDMMKIVNLLLFKVSQWVLDKKQSRNIETNRNIKVHLLPTYLPGRDFGWSNAVNVFHNTMKSYWFLDYQFWILSIFIRQLTFWYRLLMEPTLTLVINRLCLDVYFVHKNSCEMHLDCCEHLMFCVWTWELLIIDPCFDH